MGVGYGSSEAEILLARFDAMKRERALVDKFYQSASFYFDPINANYWGADHAEKREPNFNGDLYTGAGISSLNRLTNFLQGNGTPASARWLELTDFNDDLMENQDVAQFWADSSHLISNELRGDPGTGSSFYIAMRDAYKSLGISYGVVHVGEYVSDGFPTGRVYYEAVPSHAFWFQLDAFGAMAAGAYLRSMTDAEAQILLKRNVIDAEDEEDRSRRSSDRKKIVQMVIRNERAKLRPKTVDEFPYREYWIDIAERKILRRAGYRSQPFHVLGWNKVPGSNYYVGPAYDALPDVTGAAAARKAQLQMMGWAARPPLLGASKDGLDNPAKTLIPGRITWGTVNRDGKPLMVPLQNGSQPAVMQYQVSDDEARVRSLMMNDELLSQRRPQMTATEAQIIAQERAAMVAPFMVTTLPGIKGMIQRHFEIRLRLGGLPDVPPQVLRDGGFDASISGPLAIAARQADVGSIFQTIEQFGMLAQFDPLASRAIDIEEAMRLIASANGTTALLADFEKVKREMSQAAQMQSEMAEAQIAETQARAAKTGVEAMAVAQ